MRLFEILVENASSGATSAGSVATAVSSISPVIRRPPPSTIVVRNSKRKRKRQVNEINLSPEFNVEIATERVKRNYEYNKASLKFLTRISVANVFVDNWPLLEENQFYFLDSDGNVGGGAFVLKSHVNISDTYVVKDIFLGKTLRGKGIAFQFYSFLLRSGYNLLSDVDHTNASKRLWQRLSEKFSVYLYEKETDRIIKRITDTSIAYENGYLLLAKA